jgi:hypothetical protein
VAFSTSGLFIPTWMDALDTTQFALNLDLDTHMVAMFTNSITTPNFSTNTAYGSAPFNANEVSGTGYTAGGAALTGTTLTDSPSGTLKWDGDDVDWATSTISAARGAVGYAAAASDELIAAIAFGADYSTVAGLFRIQWHASGIVTIDITP